MNAPTKDTRAHWSEQVEDLTNRIAAADAAIEDARIAASAAALEGGDLALATRELAHARDVADALRSALGEAKRHLQDAEAAEAQRARERALARAQTVARKRVDIADQIDSFLASLAPLVGEWLSLGETMSREMKAAGLRVPSRESLTGGHKIRAAAWARAPGFMHMIDAARVPHDHRVPLRQTSAAHAAPILKGEDPADVD